ncbi:hypothetical protein [Pseudobacteriovorax antillogorgiicola]|uniref:Uncharacterized protein n=1 Tax=Pseudobacteriovorax antillogorgiicola TaxID=1513793 RepID=A0A1Y6CPJ4_9BACT|nr:hypothetical protein [Pseudobacteriovorax antillogorgiicola]TCS46910.1 hypothetical protein EDD56_1225 [Pseudobacteriovorax antillogorgiicola]SMF64109.1 hypothetical protein SAMN06296036_1225 [Pseudobacteriovorax antillogorgiicola]
MNELRSTLLVLASILAALGCASESVELPKSSGNATSEVDFTETTVTNDVPSPVHEPETSIDNDSEWEVVMTGVEEESVVEVPSEFDMEISVQSETGNTYTTFDNAAAQRLKNNGGNDPFLINKNCNDFVGLNWFTGPQSVYIDNDKVSIWTCATNAGNLMYKANCNGSTIGACGKINAQLAPNARDACGCPAGQGWSRAQFRCVAGSITDGEEIAACQKGQRLSLNNNANTGRDACGCPAGQGWSRAQYRCVAGSITDGEEIAACQKGQRLSLNNNASTGRDACGCPAGQGWSRAQFRCAAGSLTDGEEIAACQRGQRLGL